MSAILRFLAELLLRLLRSLDLVLLAAGDGMTCALKR